MKNNCKRSLIDQFKSAALEVQAWSIEKRTIYEQSINSDKYLESISKFPNTQNQPKTNLEKRQ